MGCVPFVGWTLYNGGMSGEVSSLSELAERLAEVTVGIAGGMARVAGVEPLRG